MNERVEAFFRKARRALKTAKSNLEMQDAEAAVNRAYYAAFYAATAALHSVGESPRTHAGVHRLFHLHFGKTGRVAPAIEGTLTHAFYLRQRADYEALAMVEEAGAWDLIADVESFVDAVESILLP